MSCCVVRKPRIDQELDAPDKDTSFTDASFFTTSVISVACLFSNNSFVYPVTLNGVSIKL